MAELDTEFGATLVAAAQGLDPLRARAVLSRQFPGVDHTLLLAASRQAALATQAEPRFGARAWEMLWTSDGLAQASHPGIAQYRAQRLVTLGVRTAVDLTCGLGIDLLAMADNGIDVLGIEADPEIADLARRNALRRSTGTPTQSTVSGANPATVEIRPGSATDDSTLASLAHTDAWFLDPARRGTTRRSDGSHIRLDDPEAWSPPWSWVQTLAGRDARPELVVAKTAPGISHHLVADASAEWLSLGGQLREVTAWWGAGDAGARAAVIVAPDGVEIARISAAGTVLEVSGLPAPGGWLWEPDPAIIRAHVVSEFGERIGATMVDPRLAYLAVAEPRSRPDTNVPITDTELTNCARTWQVVYSGPYRPAPLRELCADLGITRIDVTGRGRTLPAERVARELRLPGGPGLGATLITMALGAKRRTAVVLGIPAVTHR